MPTELEIKLLIAPERAAAIDAALRRLPGSRRITLDAHYLDTADGRLARRGIALRLRRAGRVWEQTLKAAGATPVEREEYNVPRPGRRAAGEVPPVDLALHRGTRAGGLLRAALDEGDAGGRALGTVYRVAVTRRIAVVEHGGAQVEIAFDLGWITAGKRRERVCELEYELKSGDAAALVALAQAAVLAQGALLSVLSKAARGDRLARGDAAPVAHKAGAPQLDRAMAPGALWRDLLGSCVAQVLANASEVAAGTWDDETVHQWRIGLRRLRTLTHELAPSAPGAWLPWSAALGEAFRVLGAYRDRRTVALAQAPLLAAAGSPDPELLLQPGPAPGGHDPAAIVRAPAVQQALLEALGDVLAAPGGEAAAALGANTPAALERIGQRLAKLQRRLRRDATAYRRMDEAARHAVRKRVKRLRYLAELVRTLYPPGKVERLLSALEPAQEALGERMDLLVALDLARERAAAVGGPAWFNVGWLGAQLAPNLRRCRKTLRRAAQARPFW